MKIWPSSWLRIVGATAIIASGLCCQAGASSTDGAHKPFILGYSAGFLTDPFQALLVNFMMQSAKVAGIKTLPLTNANGDAGKQIADVHNLISEGAQGLIVVPTDSEAIIPAVKFAAKRKVPVVAIDTGPSGGKVAMIVRADNYRMAAEDCELLGKALGGRGSVLLLMGDQASLNGRDRANGFRDCVKKDFGAIKINAQPMYWKSDKCTSAAQTVVSTTPGLGAIYMSSDVVCLAGVLNVLKSAGKLKKAGVPGHIYLYGIDGSPFALTKIREGWVDATVSQPLELYVKYGLQYLQAAVDGKTFSAGPTDHDSHIVDFNGNLMDLLPATVVTKGNVDSKSLWGNEVKE
ncbi:sugar ABC transporter substrate-binding protein [Acidisoma sp. S159]|uniref:sugar ABC transporter substrate-binding protein n=1 Tax=Acidisoma sp. S159 TaxID=1747225 RepID=UPI00131BED54|nr:sugar ABC transporter substrate-binding protein [Acidisoma sp. S159]